MNDPIDDYKNAQPPQEQCVQCGEYCDFDEIVGGICKRCNRHNEEGPQE